MKNWTTRYRTLFVTLFAIAILVALGGWLFFDRDPQKLDAVIMWLTATVGIGEASNVGKRATWKAEAAAVEREGA